METEQNNIETANNIIKYFNITQQVTGILFNILAFIIFSREKFQYTIFSTYFRYLCISDTITLIYRLQFVLQNQLLEKSLYLCKLFSYIFIYVVPLYSVWILVLISLDRCISIVCPTRFLFRKSKQNQMFASIGIIIVQMVYWLPIPIIGNIEINNHNNSNETEYEIDSYVCTYQTLTIDIMDLMDSSIIPTFLMFITTFITLRKIFKSRSRSRSRTEHSIMSTTRRQQLNQETSVLKSKDVKFAITSL